VRLEADQPESLAGLTVVASGIQDRIEVLIEAGHPVDRRHERLRGQHLAGLRVEHIEDAVLRRMHHDMPQLAVDEQIGRGDLRRAVEIEALGGSLLVIPFELARLRIERDD